MKPNVAVFFGGTSGSRDLSCETGYGVCESIPRSRFRVIPIHVTADGLWQVPLGALPEQGPAGRMISMLTQAVPAVSAREGLERLFRQPIATILTVMRGVGGDDGSLHTLGQTVGVSVVGPSPLTCQQTAHKQLCYQAVQSHVATPRWRLVKKNRPPQTVAEEITNEFSLPFFIKPATEEGSVGVERVTTADEVRSAWHATSTQGDIMLQEETPGDEYTFTLVDDVAGKIRLLPPVHIVPTVATFYDSLAKRRSGRVVLETTDWQTTPALSKAADIALGLYEELECQGLVSFDMKISSAGPTLLEINTVPNLTEHSALKRQLEAAHMSPALIWQRLLENSLMMEPRRTNPVRRAAIERS